MPTRAPSVSVVLPTYQRRGLVERAIASVLAQTRRDFELIVVDDGSTDGTDAAIAGLGDAVRYEWQPNRGVSAARNVGIALARAPVVAFLDSDNQWLPDHLAVVTEVLERRAEAVLVSTCRECITAGTQGPEDAELRDVLPNLLLRNDVGLISCAAARRDALLAAGGFDERLSVAEDSELWLRLAMRGPFAFLRRRTVIPQSTVGGLR
jgi:glycosyltransferase involved in cell wall biosynthesis